MKGLPGEGGAASGGGRLDRVAGSTRWFGRRGDAQAVLGGAGVSGAGGAGQSHRRDGYAWTGCRRPGGRIGCGAGPFGHSPHGLLGLKSSTGAFHQAPLDRRRSVPAAPRFDATMYVSASSLNLREAPDTGGRVLTSLPRNTKVLAGERRAANLFFSPSGRRWCAAPDEGDFVHRTPCQASCTLPLTALRAPLPNGERNSRRRTSRAMRWGSGRMRRRARRGNIAPGSAHARKRGGTCELQLGRGAGWRWGWRAV